ncbi:MAG TPA: PQQ-dependent sugar dehydrogenase [Acidimicrobiales bacterium]|nr:PQQ-dependent sugar dehydrogenase [Acidimicrobiales bacterium]
MYRRVLALCDEHPSDIRHVAALPLALLALVPVVACGGAEDEGHDELTQAAAPLADIDLELTSIGQFDQPISIVGRPDDTALFVAGFKGTVTRVDVAGEGRSRTYTVGEQPLLDIDDQVITEDERGLLDIAFSPDGDRLYVSYTAEPDGTHTVVSYAYNGSTLDTASRKVVFELADTEPNHNGGDLEFGPDGYLYYAMGDGGGGGDPDGNAQNPLSLFGKIMRLDPEGATGDEGYAIPADNPFADGQGGKAEVWAYGLRNPWRFSFDAETGDLWIGDVGQGGWEEVDLLPAAGGDGSAGKGANLGWNEVEGTHGYEGGTNPDGAVLPVYEYALHEEGTCAVTGGVVYRGPYEALDGAYLYGDSCQSKVRALRVEDGKVTESLVFDDAGADQLVSFGTDNGGDVYVVGMGAGEIYRIDDPTPSSEPPPSPDPTASTTTTTDGTSPSSTTEPPATTEPPSTEPPSPSTTTTGPAGTLPGDPGGLRAEYFDNVDLTGTSHSRVEPRVYLDYEHEPFEDFEADTFSVRWTGELRVDTAGEYTLTTTSDDGARLWVDDQLLVDAWSSHAVRDDARKVTLAAGRHRIRMEYYEDTGVAVARLSWAGPGIPREVIPGPNLHPAGASA